MKKLLGGLTVTAILLASCGKDDEEATNTTLGKLQHKWQVETIKYNAVLNGNPFATTYPGTATDYVDFRTDGKVYSYYASTYDTSAYSVYNDNKIIIDGDTADIRELTDTKFVSYGKETVNATNYTEVTINLKR